MQLCAHFTSPNLRQRHVYSQIWLPRPDFFKALTAHEFRIARTSTICRTAYPAKLSTFPSDSFMRSHQKDS
jgi:hypothetical protein